ncbi:MAG: hypothetical protein KKG60_03305 [Nanoarchaeota archaeon]|nr:hypothetical protein [Nanoarchaeota archaeon]
MDYKNFKKTTLWKNSTDQIKILWHIYFTDAKKEGICIGQLNHDLFNKGIKDFIDGFSCLDRLVLGMELESFTQTTNSGFTTKYKLSKPGKKKLEKALTSSELPNIRYPLPLNREEIEKFRNLIKGIYSSE